MRTIRATAPIRVCDIGGWTDTWFARHGAVFNIAVSPQAGVKVVVFPRTGDRPRVVLDVVDFGDRYAFEPGETNPPRHPLLEATIEQVGLPEDAALEISVHCDAPSGASTGTSAAVATALVGALDELGGGHRSRLEVARTAHAVEVERLGLQSGVQDQLCSAFGGVNFIEITDYPHAVVTGLKMSDEFAAELEERLVLVYLGRGHISSQVHSKVVAALEVEGPESPRLVALRELAAKARAAVDAGDLDGLGQIMRENTDAQAALHPDLVCGDAMRVIDTARASGVSGWKVNGAGGDGGSVTLLARRGGDPRRALIAAVQRTDERFNVIPTRLCRTGLRVRDDA